MWSNFALSAVIALIWITFTWAPVPDAENYRVEASYTYGRTWSNISYGATTETRVPVAEDLGTILFRLTVVYQDGNERKSSIGWWFDPSLGSPYMVDLGVK